MKRIIAVGAMVMCAGCTTIAKKKDAGAQLQPQVKDVCGQRLQSLYATPESAESRLNVEIEEYQVLAEESLTQRAETIKVAQRLLEKTKGALPLSGDDLYIINRGVVSHLELRKRLYEAAESHECWTDLPEGAGPLGLTPEMRLKGVMISLSAALILYDNYLLGISLFEENDKLRRLLNQPDLGYDIGRAELDKVTMSYTSARNRSRVRSAIKYYENERSKMPPSFFEDRQVQYLELLISQSPSYSSTRAISPVSYLWKKVDFLGAVTEDSLIGIGNDGMNLFSMLFGNALGIVETRKGKLYNRPEVARELKETLRAGDIILEKTPFRLTDKLIPGFWGHAAIWVGTEHELRELGIWDNPVVAKYHGEIRQGRLVVEALRSGVEMNSLEHFLNIDDMGVIRRGEHDPKKAAETIILALRQVGKSYDFNFDVETTDKIVCSELVYLVYPEIQWPTAKTLGRATFSPDHVATKALNGPLQFISFYHDGRRIETDPVVQLATLMEGKKKEK